MSLHTTFSLAKWSMAIYLITIALSQLIYGPLSEGIGRKVPLAIGIAIMATGSFVCMLANSIDMLIVGRLIQGCGAGACAALWRPVFRDMFTGDQLAKVGSFFGIFLVFVVSAAPAIGGYLEHFFSWRASFIFLSCYSLLTLSCVMIFFKETSQHHHLERLKLNYIVKTYKQLLTHPLFIGLAFCSFLAFGGIFAWTTSGSILLIHGVHMSPITFGWVLGLGGGAAYISAMKLNSQYVEKFGATAMIRFGAFIMFLAGIIMLLLGTLIGLNAWAIAAPAILFTFGAAFIFPNAFAKAFTPFGNIAGYAGALYGAIQVAGGGALGSIVSHIPVDMGAIPLALIFIIVALLIALVHESTKLTKTK